MKNIIRIIAALIVVSLVTSCDDLFSPAIENIKDESSMENDPGFADGILGSAYILMPYPEGSVSDVGTDDAVSNDIDNAFLSMANGSWTSRTSQSVNDWRDRNASIQYTNLFLEHVDKVTFVSDENMNQMFRDRLKGEAYGLRALNMYHLLLNYGGVSVSGELLGVQIWTSSYNATTDMNIPRSTFAQCMERLDTDCRLAAELLPTDFTDLTGNSQLPAKYASLDIDYMDYNRVFGGRSWTRMTGRIVEAIRAQAALLAASPAYSEGSGVTWAEAADYAAIVLDRIGGVSGLAPDGHIWYSAEIVGNNDDAFSNHPEIIWRGGIGESSSLEAANFPPSLYGTGRVNPTQNLVDAFPMANGYPITDSRSGYQANNPYAGRDPRLAAYIVTNGSTLGVNNAEINTSTTSSNNDGINKEAGHSTRTGYYMRKHLRTDVNPNSTNTVNKYHYTKRIRYTEIFLAYAEAANEAWGPTGKGNHSYSAYDVIKAIRERAGIGNGGNSDPYLDLMSANKDSMRELIHNERRLELCFENQRFWDLRRWKANLNETAEGVLITRNTYDYIDVEPRRYSDYMIYGPIPYDDILKFSNLEQNKGW